MTNSGKTLADLTAHYVRIIDHKRARLMTEAQGISDHMNALIARLGDGMPPSQCGELQRAAQFNSDCGELAMLMQVVEDMKGWAKADKGKES